MNEAGRRFLALALCCAFACTLAVATNANAQALVDDDFTYADGNLTDNAAWSAHSGEGVGPVQVSSGAIGLNQGAASEDVNTTFTAIAAGETLYAGFDLNTTSGSNQTYFAHFMVGTGSFSARVFTGSPVAGGNYTLGIRTNSASSPVKLTSDLSFGVTYRVVFSYEFDTGTSKVWVDPALETDPFATDTDAAATSRALNAFAFCQSTGNAIQNIDNLIVSKTFSDVIGSGPATGACCQGAACTIETAGDCSTLGGTYQGDGTGCTPNPCSGACCVGATCTVETPSGCTTLGGIYQGAGTDCDPNPCVGACCDGATCTIELEADCIALPGAYQGDGTTCTPNFCGGACCVGATCTVETEADCATLTGDFRGLGSDCDPNPCVGACCDGTTCTVETEIVCLGLGYEYIGDGTDCTLPWCDDVPLIITEILDGTLPGGNPKFIEITNVSGSPYTFPGGGVIVQSNEGTDTNVDVDLTGVTIAAGQAYVISNSGTAADGGQTLFESTYSPMVADMYDGSVAGNGDDRYILTNRDDGSKLIDIYGVLNLDGTGQTWEYTNSYACRLTSVTSGNGGVFAEAEWFIAGVNALETGNDTTELPLIQASTSPKVFVCDGAPTPTGACCDGETCTVETEADCAGVVVGTYKGDWVPCTPNPCLIVDLPDLIISEICDGTIDSGQPKWVEITNVGTVAVDMTTVSIGNVSNGDATMGYSAEVLTGTLPAGEAYVVGYDGGDAPGDSTFYDVYGEDADNMGPGSYINGNDVVVLFFGAGLPGDPCDGSGTPVIDVYGVVGEDGVGTVWEYTDSYAYRLPCATVGTTTFVPSEWFFAGADALDGVDGPGHVAVTDPGTHFFATPPFAAVTVTTHTAGAGTGTVDVLPVGPYFECDTITLTANPTGLSVFDSWSGDIESTVNPLVVALTGDLDITANFSDCTGKYSITAAVVGNGSVTKDPDAVCYATSTVVSLTPEADAGWIFDGWTGPDVPGGSENDNPLNLTVGTADMNVTANFLELFRVRGFVTGNGDVVFNTTPDEVDAYGNNWFKGGTAVSLTGNAGTIGSPVTTWTLDEWHDGDLVQLGTTSPLVLPPLTANVDATARFVETPLNLTAQAFTPGNIVVGEIKDYEYDWMIELREYDPNGYLVQPVIEVPMDGAPSGQADSPASTTIFQIGFDVANDGLLYIAANGLDDLDPEWTGFIRTQFSGGAHTFDLSGGRASTQAARGVAVNGNDVYFTNGTGLYHYPIDTGIATTVFSRTTRHAEFYAGDLYVSTSSDSSPYDAGQGIYRIDDPLGTPVATQIVSMPGGQPLEFAFADADTLYVACVTDGDPTVFEGIHKFKYETGAWVSKGNFGLLLGTWGRGLDLVVDGDDVTIYSVTSTSDVVEVNKISDTLTGSAWPNGVPVEIVPEATRGRAIAVVPGASLACQTCGGDFDGDNSVSGLGGGDLDYIGDFVDALLGVTPMACSDVNEDTFVDGLDIQEFITLVLANGANGTPCSGGTAATNLVACQDSGGSAPCPPKYCRYLILPDPVPGETSCVGEGDLTAWEYVCVPCLAGETCDEGAQVVFQWVVDPTHPTPCYFYGEYVFEGCSTSCDGLVKFANAE